MTESQTTKRRPCPSCDGRGTVMSDIDWFTGVMTLGMTALIDASTRVDCKVCDGKGYLNE